MEHDTLARVWDIVENIGVCMLTTQSRSGLRSRPLELRPDRATGLIYFVIDVRGTKMLEIEACPDVGLVLVDPKDKAYLSISGCAHIARDEVKTREVWRRTDEVWWPGGPSDVDVRLLIVEPLTAELWDGPASAAVAAFEFAKARLTGAKPNLGENRKVTVGM